MFILEVRRTDVPNDKWELSGGGLIPSTFKTRQEAEANDPHRYYPDEFPDLEYRVREVNEAQAN